LAPWSPPTLGISSRQTARRSITQIPPAAAAEAEASRRFDGFDKLPFDGLRVSDTAGRLKAPRLKAPREIEGLTLAATREERKLHSLTLAATKKDLQGGVAGAMRWKRTQTQANRTREIVDEL
jgi:hypothetical protein